MVTETLDVQSEALRNRRYERSVKLTNWITYALISFLIIDSVVSMSIICHRNQDDKLIIRTITWYFFVFGCVFLVTGVTMALRVRKYYPDFYREFGKLIWIATFLLALPLFYRTVNDWMYRNWPSYQHYYMKHFAFMNTLFIILSSIVPLLAQITSLLFGASNLRSDSVSNSRSSVDSSRFSSINGFAGIDTDRNFLDESS